MIRVRNMKTISSHCYYIQKSVRFAEELEEAKTESEKEDNSSGEEEELKEDIYGRLRDKKGNLVQDSKYIPPAKRLEMAQNADSDYQAKLQAMGKQLKGYLNRSVKLSRNCLSI